MNEFRYQVLLIANEKDLTKEYRLAQETLAANHAFISGFPFPLHTDNYLWKLNQNGLNDADYVVIITGADYGSLSQTGVGFVHRLFASAQALNKPVLSLIYRGNEKEQGDATDQLRLAELEAQLLQGVVREWKNKDDLQMQLEIGFEKLVEHYPSRGWIRPEHLMSNAGQEVKALKRQLKLLKKELENQRQGEQSEEFQIPMTVPYQCKAFIGGNMKPIEHQVTLTAGWIFSALAPHMMDETAESKIRTSFFEQVLDHQRKYLGQKYPESHAFVDLKVPLSVFNSIKVNLRAHGLMTIRQGKWKLTPLGEHRLLSSAKASGE